MDTLTPEQIKRLVEAADDLHEAAAPHLAGNRWWLELGFILDELKPLVFRRNTGGGPDGHNTPTVVVPIRVADHSPDQVRPHLANRPPIPSRERAGRGAATDSTAGADVRRDRPARGDTAEEGTPVMADERGSMNLIPPDGKAGKMLVTPDCRMCGGDTEPRWHTICWNPGETGPVGVLRAECQRCGYGWDIDGKDET